jgi:hypothetical protein
MSKDPAFLFYSSDFLTGTMFMDNDQVGKFIRLMCAQHQKGRLTKKDMLKICVTHDEDIFSKFAVDEAGLYYNERLEEEVTKRKAYSESRRNNRKKKEDVNNISESYVPHMENENENEIIDEVNNKLIIKNEFQQLWDNYKKGARKVAWERYEKLSQSVRSQIIIHAPQFVQNHMEADKEDYLPHFSTYITKERWNDELPYKPKLIEQPTQPTQKRFNIADYE